MLVSKAYTRYLRVSPRKVRGVIDLIRGAKVVSALTTLDNLNKQVKRPVQKTLQSAISNALQNPAVKIEELFISKIYADNGPMMKRYRAAAMGRATMIRHRTTHIAVELSRKEIIRPKTKPKARVKAKPKKQKKSK